MVDLTITRESKERVILLEGVGLPGPRGRDGIQGIPGTAGADGHSPTESELQALINPVIATSFSTTIGGFTVLMNGKLQDAETYLVQTSAAKDIAISSRDAAIAARDIAVGSINSSSASAAAALASKNAAAISETNAGNSATTATTKAGEAAASAASALTTLNSVSLAVSLSKYASLAAANTAAVSLDCTLNIDVNVTLTANTTLTAKAVRFNGGIITRGAYSLTINGMFSAQGQVFDRTGTGRVIFAGGIPGNIIDSQWFGVKGDGVTDCSPGFDGALNATDAITTAAQPRHFTISAPPGDCRITRTLLLKNPRWDSYYTLDGVGRENTRIHADFFATVVGPTITLGNTGGGTGAILIPVIDNGVLTAVLVPPTPFGSGYDPATTATLTVPSGGTGSGATMSLTIVAGVITAVTVLNGGSGYNSRTSGDAIVLAGQGMSVKNLTVSGSDARIAAGNGGKENYPYNNINNGVSVVGTRSFILSIPQIQIHNVGCTAQPGHGFNITRGEQVSISSCLALFNKSDGFMMHDDQMIQGISNTFISCRSVMNGYRGYSILGMQGTTTIGLVSLRNLTVGAVNLPVGVNEEVAVTNRSCSFIGSDIEREEGTSGGFYLLKLTGNCHNVLGGYFNGGLRQIYLSAAGNCMIKSTVHYGHAGDVTATGIFMDGASNNNELGGNIGGSTTYVTVLIGLDSAIVAPIGYHSNVLRMGQVRGGLYTTTQAATFTPNLSNGSDQMLTMSGNVTINAPSSGDAHGLEFNITLVQNATGGFTPTFNSKFVLADTMTSAVATKILHLRFKCIVAGARTIWLQVNKGAVWL